MTGADPRAHARPVVVGLDLSSTSTGVCAAGECDTIEPKGDLLTRARAMRDGVRVYALPADIVVIEAIGTRHVQTAIAIATVHALVNDALVGQVEVVHVSPASLKKFATGKGSAKKDQMLIAALAYGAPVKNNDEADAWWLWCIGETIGGRLPVPLPEYRRTVIEGLAS